MQGHVSLCRIAVYEYVHFLFPSRMQEVMRLHHLLESIGLCDALITRPEDSFRL